jgi:hypothetical protein
MDYIYDKKPISCQIFVFKSSDKERIATPTKNWNPLYPPCCLKNTPKATKLAKNAHSCQSFVYKSGGLGKANAKNKN